MPLMELGEGQYFKLADVISVAASISKSDARRLIKGRGVTVWYTKEDPNFATNRYSLSPPDIPDDPNVTYECTEDDYWVIKAGKRKFLSVSQAIGELLVVAM